MLLLPNGVVVLWRNAAITAVSALIMLISLCFSNALYSNEPKVEIQELPINQRSNPQYEFEFARVVYDGGYEWPRWRADWPDAEFHFSKGLKRLTRIDVSSESAVIALDDQSLFEYPWLYVVEVGYWSLSNSERNNLKEYLLRGGFLMVDDFHGIREWANFESVMRDVFPDRKIVKLAHTSALFNVHFAIEERTQIPGIRSIMNNRTWEKGGVNPGWFGILDDFGRVMVAINFNQDIGDAWEHADDAIYPEVYTGLAYRMGVNYVVYAMSH